jgi:hypothetical protein
METHNGHKIPYLQKSIRENIRKGNFEAGMYCVVELDLFLHKEHQANNPLIELFISICSQEIGIGVWYMPILIHSLWKKWISAKQSIISRQYIYKMYKLLLTSQKCTYVNDIYLFFHERSKPQKYIKATLDEPIKQYNSFEEALENNSDYVFSMCIRWNQLITICNKYIKDKKIPDVSLSVINILYEFYKKSINKRIFLTHAVALILNRKQVEWNIKMPDIYEHSSDIVKWYNINYTQKNIPSGTNIRTQEKIISNRYKKFSKRLYEENKIYDLYKSIYTFRHHFVEKVQEDDYTKIAYPKRTPIKFLRRLESIDILHKMHCNHDYYVIKTNNEGHYTIYLTKHTVPIQLKYVQALLDSKDISAPRDKMYKIKQIDPEKLLNFRHLFINISMDYGKILLNIYRIKKDIDMFSMSENLHIETHN